MMLGGIRFAIVRVDAISAVMKARYSPRASCRGPSERASTATSAADEPDMPAKSMLDTGDDLRQPAANVADQCLRQRDHSRGHVGAVISSPTSRKNGTASSASTSMPLNSWVIIDGRPTGVNAVTTSTPAISAKATGTPR